MSGLFIIFPRTDGILAKSKYDNKNLCANILKVAEIQDLNDATEAHSHE